MVHEIPFLLFVQWSNILSFSLSNHLSLPFFYSLSLSSPSILSHPSALFEIMPSPNQGISSVFRPLGGSHKVAIDVWKTRDVVWFSIRLVLPDKVSWFEIAVEINAGWPVAARV